MRDPAVTRSAGAVPARRAGSGPAPPSYQPGTSPAGQSCLTGQLRAKFLANLTVCAADVTPGRDPPSLLA